MSGTTTIRGLSMLCAVLTIGLAPGRSQASDDPWPLVNAADLAVWGTLVHSTDGPASRLLVVRPDGEEDRAGPLLPVRLADHVVGLPDGTSVHLQARGLFLATTADPRDPGFAAVAGTIITGGFLPGWPESAVRERVLRLAVPAEDDPPFGEEDALALLAADWFPARALALGWWAARTEPPSPAALAALGASLADGDPRWLRPALEAHLLRGWPLPTGGLAPLVVESEDPVLADLALHAIERHGGTAARAELVLAWPGATDSGRVRLLGAYARLAIAEAGPRWLEALGSADPELRGAAVRGLGRSGLPGAMDSYRTLLAADDERVVALALEGLADAGTPRAAELLGEFIAGRAEDDPLAIAAERLLRKPRRNGVRPPHPSPPESDER